MLSNCVQTVLEPRPSINPFRLPAAIAETVSRSTHAFDLDVAFAAIRRDETLEAILAIELSLFFHESNVLKRPATLGVHANEMIGAPYLSQSGDERAPE